MLLTVFLLHGILNHDVSMKRMERALKKEGFEVVSLDYPSRRRTVEEHAAWLDKKVRETGKGDLYFVGHSLGSIIIRYYLAHYQPADAKRFVMITPPNHGSMRADKVNPVLFRLIWGRESGGELRASSKDFWEKLPPPPIEFGIIAGGKGDGKGFAKAAPGDDDGVLSVDETRLEGAADFAILPYRHVGIEHKKKTIELTVRFLKTGKF